MDPSKDVLHLRVMNMMAGPQKIEKGSDLAKCEQVEAVVEQHDQPKINPNLPQELPKQSKELYDRSAGGLQKSQKLDLWRLLLENVDLFSQSSDDL